MTHFQKISSANLTPSEPSSTADFVSYRLNGPSSTQSSKFGETGCSMTFGKSNKPKPPPADGDTKRAPRDPPPKEGDPRQASSSYDHMSNRSLAAPKPPPIEGDTGRRILFSKPDQPPKDGDTKRRLLFAKPEEPPREGDPRQVLFRYDHLLNSLYAAPKQLPGDGDSSKDTSSQRVITFQDRRLAKDPQRPKDPDVARR